MARASLFFLAAFALAALAGTGAANACPCPKEAMIKKYGTVGMIRDLPPAPPTKPAPPATGG